MGLSKSNSRPLTVGDRSYRWAISPRRDHVIFVAEAAEVKGRRIEVRVDTDIASYWVEFPQVADLNVKVVKPGDAASIILNALKKGWDPTERGAPLKFEFQKGTLTPVDELAKGKAMDKILRK